MENVMEPSRILSTTVHCRYRISIWIFPKFSNFLYCFFLFFWFKLILFYFLNLQYCIGFAIYQNESATGIHVFPIWTLLPPPSPYHPSGSSQCTSPKHPVSCIEPGLAPHFIYDIIHVSMSFSQIIPPSPSPTESKRLSCFLNVLIHHSHLEKEADYRKVWITLNVFFCSFTFPPMLGYFFFFNAFHCV